MIQKILNYLKKLIPIDLDSMVLESSENESNVYQKYGVAAAAGTAVALFSLFIMAFLIATGEVQLDEIKTRKIVDIVMPQRDPELLDSVERPEEAEPEPEQTPPDVDIENIDDVLDDALNLNFKFGSHFLSVSIYFALTPNNVMFSFLTILSNRSFLLYIGKPSKRTIDALDANTDTSQFHIIQPHVVKYNTLSPSLISQCN